MAKRRKLKAQDSALTAEAFLDMLEAAGLNQSEAARTLGLSLRTVQYYVAGELPIPRVVYLAMEALVSNKSLRRREVRK